MPRWYGLWAAVGLAALLAGCKQDPPYGCDLPAQGEFVYSVIPQLPSGTDPTADISLTISGAVLDTVIVTPNVTKPLLTYRFHAPGYNRLDVQLNDVLVDAEPDPAKRGFPVEKGQTYALHFEMSQHVVPPAMAIQIKDAAGVRFFGVNDWRPGGTDGAQIYENGYGSLNDDGQLEVLFIDVGCESQNVNFDCYQVFSNRRLDFVIGSDGPLGLFSGEVGTLGHWLIHVYKGAKVVGKAGCTEALLHQNGVSFTMERVGLR
jgi:hypothetical protein